MSTLEISPKTQIQTALNSAKQRVTAQHRARQRPTASNGAFPNSRLHFSKSPPPVERREAPLANGDRGFTSQYVRRREKFAIFSSRSTGVPPVSNDAERPRQVVSLQNHASSGQEFRSKGGFATENP